MIIYLTRHGQTNQNLIKNMRLYPDTPLNDTGRLQALQVANKLLNEKDRPEVIFSSEMIRAQQTAKIISQTLDIPVDLDNRLNEFNFGIFEGQAVSSQEIYKGIENKSDRFEYIVPGGESDELVVKRLIDFKEQLLSLNKNVLICTHDAILFFLKLILNGYSYDEIVKQDFATTPHTEYVKLSI